MSYPGKDLIIWFKENLNIFKEEMSLSDQQLNLLHNMYTLIGPSFKVDQEKAAIAAAGLGITLDVSEIEHITKLAERIITIFNASPEDRNFTGIDADDICFKESKFDVFYNELLTE